MLFLTDIEITVYRLFKKRVEQKNYEFKKRTRRNKEILLKELTIDFAKITYRVSENKKLSFLLYIVANIMYVLFFCVTVLSVRMLCK